MGLTDWLLALHLLAAALLVAAVVMFAAVAVACRRAARVSDIVAYTRLGRAAVPLVGAGALLTLVLGVWLAIREPAYEVWDGWILAAIVLWIIGVGTGQTAGRRSERVDELAREQAARAEETPGPALLEALHDRRALVLQVVSGLAIVLILVDMLFKPGA